MRGRAGTALALAAGAAGVAVNVFGRRAPWRVYPWYLAGLVPGLAGSELPGPLAAARLAAAGVAAGLGAGNSRLGRFGLLAGAGATVSLLDLRRSALGAADVLDAALAETEPYLVTPDARAEPVIVRDVRYH